MVCSLQTRRELATLYKLTSVTATLRPYSSDCPVLMSVITPTGSSTCFTRYAAPLVLIVNSMGYPNCHPAMRNVALLGDTDRDRVVSVGTKQLQVHPRIVKTPIDALENMHLRRNVNAVYLLPTVGPACDIGKTYGNVVLKIYAPIFNSLEGQIHQFVPYEIRHGTFKGSV